MAHEPQGLDRRVIPQRNAKWAARIADALAALKLTPNGISVISVGFGVVAGVALVLSSWAAPRELWLVVAALCIPLRLLCNMLDGMLAVEHGLRTPTGDLFNEVPDRIADLVVLACAGYATTGVWFWWGQDLGVLAGWVAAAAAVLTAYVRTLGAANGVGNFFDGPLAKPHRMWVVVVASLLSMVEPVVGWDRGTVLAWALALIGVGSIVTVVRRLGRIAAALNARGSGEGR